MVLDWWSPAPAGPAAAGPAALLPTPEAMPSPPVQESGAGLRTLPGLQHPLSNRQAVLGNLAVAYHFKRSRRRTVGMQITPNGLVVTAPAWVPLHEVDRILQARADWIVRKLQEQQHTQAAAPARLQWQDGMQLPYLGGHLVLRLVPPRPMAGRPDPPRKRAATTARLEPAHGNSSTIVGELHLALPQSAASGTLPHAVECWYREQALQRFHERAALFAPLLGVTPRQIRLSAASTRWGSASSQGVIRLHWRLLELAPDLIDYVVVHELSHLREMNHSPRFWHLVGQVLPHYRPLRTALKATRLSPWQ